MASDEGWRPLDQRPRRVGAEAFRVSPFTRLARTHAAAVAGDTLIALALAGSLFFSMEPDAARGRIALYLALTMAPFSVVAPLIGPALDRARGGRRLILIGANALRAVMCLFMIRHLDSLLLFPEAFTVMVLSKSYAVAKSAVVPTTVRNDGELVEANSRLSFLSGIMGFVAAGPGGLASLIAGSQGVLVLALVMFLVAAGFATRIPATRVAKDPTSVEEREELRSSGILLAASAMGLLRGMVGFLTFLVAFELRNDDADPWQFGVALAASGLGALSGSLVAPLLRRSGLAEERILQTLLAVTAAGGILCAYAGGLPGMAAMAAAVGTAAGGSKLAFDAILQRDAPDANRGRSFAKFETRFQLIWVVGAFIPVVVPIPARIGFLIISGGAAFALFSYLAGIRALRAGKPPTRRRNPLATLARPLADRATRVVPRPGARSAASGAASRLDGPRPPDIDADLPPP
ncbi:MAG TPA: MFS transporter, partial [Acidimicrobiales bacterium]